jgi:SAM-dependent methyltransferase
MTDALRVVDYDRIADRYDRRYELYDYNGVLESLQNFLTPTAAVAAEVGCGTGHWLRALAGHASAIVGLEPSAAMLQRARGNAAGAQLVRGRAEALPWKNASVDRIVCVNALHHFSDRLGFFAEARRVLRPGGALMSIGKDPHAGRDEWWVYDFFEGTRALDEARFAPVRILRGELALSGFAWAESFEADRFETVRTATEAFASGLIDRAFTSQLSVLSDVEFDRGVERIKDAQAQRAADGADLHLISDFRLFATVGRL